jgi:Flp pilus assembly protein TadG
MMRSYARIRGAEREGAAAVEFALVGPVFFLLLVGMIVYGAWFWMAHSVQSAVSEGARAAIAGLDAAEREQLAREVVEAQLKDLGLKAADAGRGGAGRAGAGQGGGRL